MADNTVNYAAKITIELPGPVAETARLLFFRIFMVIADCNHSCLLSSHGIPLKKLGYRCSRCRRSVYSHASDDSLSAKNIPNGGLILISPLQGLGPGLACISC